MANLNLDIDMLNKLEQDLIDKVIAAADAYPEVRTNVYGIFSLDHLETLVESEIQGGMVVGVGYLGAQPMDRDDRGPGDRGMRAAKALDFNFIVLLGVPVADGEAQRYNAGKMLTILRQALMGSIVKGDRVQRTWDFVQEKPEISASTQQMQYYSQVWRVFMPTLGKQVNVL